MNTSEKNNKLQIQDLFEKLRQKLNSFEVINLSGQAIGRLKDFTLDKNRRLYMVIPQSSNKADSVILLSSKYIEHVDSANRAVFVNISQAELKGLPLYRYSHKTELSNQSSRMPMPENITAEMDNTEQSQEIKAEDAANQLQETENHLGRSESLANEGETIRLLEERLIVNRSQRKLGEIVVRKQIETRIIEVPLKSEKLIVEKISSETQEPVEVEQLPNRDFSNSEDSSVADYEHQSFTTPTHQNADSAESQVVEEEIVRLLEERLVVNLRKWKVGEVIVRKEIETETVQVPIRREKLIVEQFDPQTTATKIIAEIDLAGEITGIELKDQVLPTTPSAVDAHNPNTVVGELLSPRAASNLLEAIALQKHHGCTKVRVELIVENSELQETYQKMFDRCSTR